MTRPLYGIMGYPASRQLANLDAAQRDSCAAGRIMAALIAWSVSDVQVEIVSYHIPSRLAPSRCTVIRYYTSVPWDLPCDCGLTCPGVPSSNPGVRCCGNGSAQCTWAAEANPVPPAPTNPDKDQGPGSVNYASYYKVADGAVRVQDLPFASSSVLESFAAGNLSAEQAREVGAVLPPLLRDFGCRS